jgi:hypothetical protein
MGCDRAPFAVSGSVRMRAGGKRPWGLATMPPGCWFSILGWKAEPCQMPGQLERPVTAVPATVAWISSCRSPRRWAARAVPAPTPSSCSPSATERASSPLCWVSPGAASLTPVTPRSRPGRDRPHRARWLWPSGGPGPACPYLSPAEAADLMVRAHQRCPIPTPPGATSRSSSASTGHLSSGPRPDPWDEATQPRIGVQTAGWIVEGHAPIISLPVRLALCCSRRS